MIPSGLDFELFRTMPRDEARARLGLPTEGKLVLFVGDPGKPEKRLALAQQALDLVPEASLLPVWGVEREQIPLHMNAADALLLVSLWEGSPNVVKEALACDLPVVASDVGDVRERIAPVEGCVVCSDDRPETIAHAVRAVLARHGRVTGRSAVRDLDERLLAEQVIAIYKEVIRAAG